MDSFQLIRPPSELLDLTGSQSAIAHIGFAEYRAIPAVNASSLKDMAISPRQYKFRQENPCPDSDAMALGRALHTAVLEPERFRHDYVLWTGATRRGKNWKEFQRINANRTILRPEGYGRCLQMHAAVHREPAAARYLHLGLRTEVSIAWRDPETGLPCKARLDMSREGIADIKTTRDVRPRQFSRAADRFLYHVQFAFYHDGFTHVMGYKPEFFAVLAIQNTEPFDVVVYDVSEEMLRAGRREYRRLLRLLADCQASNYWPGVSETPLELDLPPWHNARELQLTSGGVPLEINL